MLRTLLVFYANQHEHDYHADQNEHINDIIQRLCSEVIK